MAETRTLDGATLRVLTIKPYAIPVLQVQLDGEKARQVLLGPETRAWLSEQLAPFDRCPYGGLNTPSSCVLPAGHAGGHERRRWRSAQEAFKAALQRREQIDESPLSFTTWLRAMAEIPDSTSIDVEPLGKLLALFAKVRAVVWDDSATVEERMRFCMLLGGAGAFEDCTETIRTSRKTPR